MPRRLVNTRCAPPRSASRRARCRPSAPRPPVISTEPDVVQPSEPIDASWQGSKRCTHAPVGRRATWSSRPSPVRIEIRAASSRPEDGTSMSPPNRSGCSSEKTRARPQIAAPAGDVSSSRASTHTAPLVTTQHLGREGAIAAAFRNSSARAIGASVSAASHV